MGAALRHRGPDDAAEFFDPTSGVGLAFRRLAILDLSEAGRQPMRSASGRYTMVFNGEVYNYEAIRRELAGPWRGHSDTEVMLAAFERWGIESAVQRFVGMFAIAVWDRDQRRLTLLRDRLGIKPLYYGHVGGDFVFASELKAIQQYPGFAATVDPEALALYLRVNYVPSPYCIYRGMAKLPPGHILTLAEGASTPEVHAYWSARAVAQNGVEQRLQLSHDELVEELHAKLKEAVALRMIADVPLGAFLSGGIDSSTVVALMQAQSAQPIKTFTIGFHEDDYNEAAWAKRIAAHLGTEHTELYLGAKESLDVIPQLPTMFDEPFADSSQIPTYLVSKLARTRVTVSLSGDGGDELFGGYQRYFLTRSLWNSVRRVPRRLGETLSKCVEAIPPAGYDRAYRVVSSLVPKRKRLSAVGDKAHKLGRLLRSATPDELYLRALSLWTPAEVMPQTPEPHFFRDFIHDTQWLPTLEERMMLTDLMNYLPDDVLTKVDRASMAVSLEARVPLLDHRVVEFAWQLPLSLKIRARKGKWALRQVLYKYVPRELVDRPKMGFGVPVGYWLRGPLRAWAEELLSPASLSRHGFFEPQPIRRIWDEHLSGRHNWQYHLWDILMFQAWYAAQSARPQPEQVRSARG